MIELNRTESVAREAAVLVGVVLARPSAAASIRWKNWRVWPPRPAFASSARLTQRREVPDMTTYLGKGKVEELRQLVDAEDADCVIFDNDLSPAQTRNLEKAVGVKVLDRTELILDIFATPGADVRGPPGRRAGAVAILAAAAEADVDALVAHQGRHRHARPGRKAARSRPPAGREADPRSEQRAAIRSTAARSGRSRARHDRMTVSLVGYTNAGKSTLLNTLTGADVLAEDKLFATLDTRTRRWQLPGWGPVLLSDTVGFIRDLPHHLIASFKATLEEARQADLLLHVADASNPAVFEQIASVYSVLEELGIEEKDTLLVLNKVDAAASAAPDRPAVGPLSQRGADQRPQRPGAGAAWPRR